MRETILLFNFSDGDRKKKLLRALLPLRMKVKEIAVEEYGKPLGDLAGIKGFSMNGEESFSGEGRMTLGELSGEMLVMAGLSENQVDQVLKALRRAGLDIPYKAVLTAANQNWNVWELFQEIKKEHETMAGINIK